MLYEIPLMGWGLAVHALAVRKVPQLQTLPVPALVALDLRFGERMPARAQRRLATVGGALHLGLSLSLGAAWVAGALGGRKPALELLGPALVLLVALLPPVLMAGAYLKGALESWREQPR